jgi:hypothetical protein
VYRNKSPDYLSSNISSRELCEEVALSSSSSLPIELQGAIQESDLDRLAEMADFRSELVVLYLQDHIQLVSLLLDALCATKKIFGDKATPVLEVVTFHDSETADKKLYLLLKTSLLATQAGELLDRFDDEWWLDHMHNADGKLSIALEFC